MNSANLQLEGLYLAIAALNELLVSKGLVTTDEIDTALSKAEAMASGDDRSDSLSPSSRDAMAFSIRLLRQANVSTEGGSRLSFTELARLVGEDKQQYNDQR